MNKSKLRELIIGAITTIGAIIIGGLITFTTQIRAIKEQKKYEFEINNINAKVKLYEETIDIYQVIENSLKPNFIEKIQTKTSVPITDAFANVMNRNALYFNEIICKEIEESINNNYWNMTKKDMNFIMQEMVKEIKEDKKRLNL